MPGRSPGCWPGCSPECSQTRLRSSARAPYLRSTRLAPAAHRRLDAACSSDRASDRIWPAPKAGVSAKGFARRQQWVVPILIARALLGDTGIHACAYPATIRQGLLAAPDAHATDTLDRGVGSQLCSDAGAAIAMAPKPWAQTHGQVVVPAARRQGGCPYWARGKPWLAGSLVRSNAEGPAPGTPAARASSRCRRTWLGQVPASLVGRGHKSGQRAGLPANRI